ncbi:MAG TPA: family 16 glycosylhydrolase [Bacteroidales bacterium]|nr:family 16 glycosylhydrolase [Bacteroidales bacterium]
MNHSKTLFFFYFLFFLPTLFAQRDLSMESLNKVASNALATDYQLVWQDNFDGTQLDETNNWVIEVNGDGGGNAELQYYRRENISVGPEPVSGAGCLIITGKKENFSGKFCTSGRLKTSGKMSFKHGKIEARIKLPHTANGLWPAFWMMGQDYPLVGWPKCGEIDILEMGNVNGINRGTQDRYFSSWFHWGESWNGGAYPNWGKDFTNPTGIQDDFHLFTLIWDDHSLKTYFDLDKDPLKAPIVEMTIDGNDVVGNAAHYFHKNFYVIFNLAIGGNFTGIRDINNITALANGNVYMYVDYVRVYQKGVIGEAYSGPALVNSIDKVASISYQIYPNPVEGQIHIEGEEIPTEVDIYSVTGQFMKKVTNTDFIDVSTLPTGIYLVKISGINGKEEMHRLIKK